MIFRSVRDEAGAIVDFEWTTSTRPPSGSAGSPAELLGSGCSR
jgi:hypothetical protein